MRKLGIDYGSKRVGLAITDESGKMAFPHKVLKNSPALAKEIEAIINTEKIGEVVIGHSLDKDNNPNKIQEEIEELMMDLTLSVGLPIHLEPEQFSTKADALQIQGRNNMTDASAPTLILDSFITKSKQ
ncbi:MAG: RuvX/YqgF family protein [Candidatus Paceibacterota bacterium]